MCKDCNSTTADNFLKNYCGIILGNADTGAITDSDAGGSKVKTAESIVPEGSTAKTFTENSFTVNGLTVKLGQRDSNFDAVDRDYNNLSDYEKYLWHHLHEYWIKGGLNLIAESYGDNFSFLKEKSYTDSNKPTTKTLYVIFCNEGKGDSAATYGLNSQKSTTDLKLHINFYYYGDATGVNGQPHDNPLNPYLDRTISHELTHAVMRANIDYYYLLPGFIKEGMAELTHGIDDARTSDLKALAANSTKLQAALNDSATVSGITSPRYAGGYMFLRYLAKQASSSTVADSINTIDNRRSNISVTGSAGNDYIYNWGANVTISGGTGNDSLQNYNGKNIVFNYASGDGNDVIYNFANDDLLKITGAFSTNYNKSKKEVYFKVGSTANAITLKNYSATSFNVNGSNYKISGSMLKK